MRAFMATSKLSPMPDPSIELIHAIVNQYTKIRNLYIKSKA